MSTNPGCPAHSLLPPCWRASDGGVAAQGGNGKNGCRVLVWGEFCLWLRKHLLGFLGPLEGMCMIGILNRVDAAG